jgi:hypothetical protein
MNQRQRLVLFVVAATIVGMLVFPPFAFYLPLAQGAVRIRSVKEYGFVFKSPPALGTTYAVVDVSRLGVQLLAVGVAGAAAIYAAAARR